MARSRELRADRAHGAGSGASTPHRQIAATPFVFTRGARGHGITINVSVNNQRPLRCIRLVGLIGVLEVGRNNQASSGTCNEWSRV